MLAYAIPWPLGLGPLIRIRIKAASSIGRALAVHAPQGMLPLGHAAVGPCCRQGFFTQHPPLKESFLYNSVACYCRYEIMYTEIRKTV